MKKETFKWIVAFSIVLISLFLFLTYQKGYGEELPLPPPPPDRERQEWLDCNYQYPCFSSPDNGLTIFVQSKQVWFIYNGGAEPIAYITEDLQIFNLQGNWLGEVSK